MAETILSNHFIGRGTVQKADQPFEALLSQKGSVLVLVSFEGRLLALNVDDLPYSADERIRLEPHDHIVGAFSILPEESLLCLTQTGKVIPREAALLDRAKSPNTRGQALISPSRLEKGTRFIGASAIRPGDHLIVLNGIGGVELFAWDNLKGSGSLPDDKTALAFCMLPAVKAKAGG